MLYFITPEQKNHLINIIGRIRHHYTEVSSKPDGDIVNFCDDALSATTQHDMLDAANMVWLSMAVKPTFTKYVKGFVIELNDWGRQFDKRGLQGMAA